MVDREAKTVFERHDSSEPALVVRLGKNLAGLNRPGVKAAIEKLGLGSDFFKDLLTRELSTSSGAAASTPKNDRGERIEEVISQILPTPDGGEIQVAEVSLFPEVVSAGPDISLHLKAGARGGFEAIYMKKGKATLSFPGKARPVALGAYANDEMMDNIFLKPGTLAIIPAPTANGWSAVGKNVVFRYLCQPPWSKDLVAPVI